MKVKVNDEQNHISFYELDVVFTAVEKMETNHCHRCILFKKPGLDCSRIPCRHWERRDRKDGFFIRK